MNRVVLPLSFLCACGPSRLAPAEADADADRIGDLPAFPGAEGFGAYATGGRGGAVLHVTTLAASGPGSLQEALDAEGPRTIVFDVSGVIDAVPILQHGDVTIAGQTSPGGVTLRGLLVQGDVVCEEPGPPSCPLPTEAPEDFVIRHLRLRPGDFSDPDGAGDGLRLHHARNGIVDHVSIGNAEDEAVQISFSSDVTLQYSLLAETQGGHAEFGGMLLNYSDPARGFPLTKLSLHHLMWNRIVGRLPEVTRENVDDDRIMKLEISNNVLYDVERPMTISSTNPQDGAWRHHKLNLVGNTTVQDPAMTECYPLLAIENGPDPSKPSLTLRSSAYLSGNTHNRVPDRTGWELVHYNVNSYCDDAAYGSIPYPDGDQPSNARSVRLPFPPITIESDPEALVDDLALHAGAFPRDPMDERLMADPLARTFDPAAPDANPAGDTLALAFDPASPPLPPTDTDQDGMPDDWETAEGLDPSDAADGNGTDLSLGALGVAGYTNLEVYLHERAESLVGG